MGRSAFKCSFALVFGLLIVLGGTAGADEPSWTTSFSSIRKAAATVESVQAIFVQSKDLKILAKPLRSEGTFAFQAPGSVRWEYRQPVRSVLLMEAGKLKRFAYRDGRFVADAAAQVETMRVVIEEIQGWLTGRFEDSKVFAASLKPGDPARVELVPRDEGMRDFIQRIELTLSDRPGVLRSVRIVESENASTTIEFEQVQLNRRIDAKVFRQPE